MSEHGPLARVYEQVIDRDAIDWDAVESTIGRSPGVTPDDLAELAMLKLLDAVANEHFTLQSGELEPGDPATRPIEIVGAGDDALTEWGRYRIDERVGRGGFGVVYRGWDPELEMAVAIKILHRGELLPEAQAMAKIRHPNVVRVLTVEKCDGRPGLVMEFLRGETLDAFVASRGVLNEREATLIAEDVCRALTAVHAEGLIHRDVKARNVIRERAGRIVLMDFGARLAPGERATTVGTPLYMAPEVMRGARASVESDVYSVGVLLFFLVTGRHPVEGVTVDDIRAAHAAQRSRSLLDLRPDVSTAFAAVVDRALAPDQTARYRSAGALLQALASLRDARPDWRRRVTRIGAVTAAVAVSMTLGGMLSAAAFNSVLGRGEYSDDSVWTWFSIGLRSVVMPLALLAMIAAGAGLLLALRNILIAACEPLARADRAVGANGRAFLRRLGLDKPAIGACWLLLLTTIGALAIWNHWLPLLRAVTDYMSTVPAERLSVLSPDSESVEYRSHYRMAMSALVVASVVGWYALSRAAAWRNERLPVWFKPGEIAVLVLLIGSMMIPYRLMHDNNEFDAVRWDDKPCHVLGRRDERVLLFCPQLMPRNQVVSPDAVQLDQERQGDGLFFEFVPPREN